MAEKICLFAWSVYIDVSRPASLLMVYVRPMGKTFKRLGIGLLVLIVVIAVALALWEPMLAESAPPPPAKSYDVEIVRDDFGVPHIFGRTDADVSYGIAYAQSEDDFEDIEQVVAMTRARLGAMTGGDGAKVDFVAHLLDIRGTVDRHYDALPADVRALLDGYAAGLNHYADTHPEELSLSDLFPVNGRDIAAGFALRSPFFFGLNDVIGPIAANGPLRQEGGPVLDGKDTRPPLGDMRPGAYASPTGKDADMNGSNAFAVAPGASDDGKTRLISNSHQPWRGGVAWYELVVHSGQGWDFAGATFAGSPYPFLGHNKNLGWTNTVNRPDLVDVYRLDMNADGTAYKLDGQWKTLETKRVLLGVKVGPFTIPYPQTVYRSVHGPVIKNDSGYYAIRYAGMDDLKMLTQYYRINKAQNFDEWKQAMSLQGVSGTNFIYADREGNIAMIYNALFPQRKAGADWRHILPGNRSDLIWRNAVPWSAYPKLVNPASGYIMNSNNTPFVAAGPGSELDRAAFSPLLGIEDDMTNRARRAIQLFEQVKNSGDGKISAQELSRIKYDTGYADAGYVKSWMDTLRMMDVSDDAQLQKAQALLKRWDWTADGKGQGDALAVMVLNAGMRKSYSRQPLPDPRETLSDAAGHLQKYFGSLDPPLGDVIRLRQGKTDLALDGGSDTLRASTLWDADPDDGRLVVRHGDSFLMFMTWDTDGKVSSRSIQPYGQAITRPDSPHFADQAPLFVAHRTKPVWFDPKSLEGHISRRYRP